MKNLKGILILFMLFVVLPFGALALLWKDRCARTTIVLLPSPNGSWTAVTERIDCGPSMKVATEVTLRPTAQTKGESVLVLAEEHGLVSAWDGDLHLILTLPPNAEVVKRKMESQGIRVDVVGSKL